MVGVYLFESRHPQYEKLAAGRSLGSSVALTLGASSRAAPRFESSSEKGGCAIVPTSEVLLFHPSSVASVDADHRTIRTKLM
jgi:hypothetical protein